MINNACSFERQDFCRTYLIFDDDRDPFELLGYFSIATKEIFIDSDSVSGSQRRKLKLRDDRPIKTFLIGQLGKNSSIKDNPLNLKSIFDEALSLIEEARAIIGGRTVILECEDTPKLIDHYKAHEFRFLQKDTDGLVTMYATLS